MTTYAPLNPGINSPDVPGNKDALLVQQADPPRFFADTTSDATYNYMCEHRDVRAKETDTGWRIQRVSKVSPFDFLWACPSTGANAGIPTMDYVHKASDRLKLLYGAQ